jgi:hypothetical protein
LYEAPAPPRPRKRAADGDLLARLALYEELMRKHDVDFDQSTSTLARSKSEVKAKEQEQDQYQDSHVSASWIAATGGPVSNACPSDDTAIRCLWSDLSSEVCSSHDPRASYGCSRCCSRLLCLLYHEWHYLYSVRLSLLLKILHLRAINISLLLNASLITTPHSSLCYSTLTSLP